MSVKIRLKRIGTKKRPQYRIVVIDSRAPRGGRPIEEIGHFNAVFDSENQVVCKKDRLEHWLQRGAKMSSTVSKLIHRI